jgi:hypothetical protein
MAFPDGYVLAEAQEAITLSAIAYQGEDEGDYGQIQAAISAMLQQFFGARISLVWLGISPDFANLLYVAQDNGASGRYAVVVRGTDWNFLTDWLDDFDVLDAHGWPYASPADPSILVAQGSWDGLQALLTMTSPTQGQTLGQVLAGLASRATTGLDLLITGHSLGGALATVLGLYLADTVGQWAGGSAPIGLKTYTFAAPTTGNAAYAAYYDARSGLADVSWQAFRIYNTQDLVPFAYADLEGFVDADVPLSPLLSLEVSAMAATVQAILNGYGVSYAQVGNGVALDPASIDGQSSCANPATTLDDFACWANFEHSSLTYMTLLGLDPDGLSDHSVNMSATATASLPRLESRAAATRALLPVRTPGNP